MSYETNMSVQAKLYSLKKPAMKLWIRYLIEKAKNALTVSQSSISKAHQ